jgi:hypothetical protein
MQLNLTDSFGSSDESGRDVLCIAIVFFIKLIHKEEPL